MNDETFFPREREWNFYFSLRFEKVEIVWVVCTSFVRIYNIYRKKENLKKRIHSRLNLRVTRTERKFCWIKEIKSVLDLSLNLLSGTTFFLNSRSEMSVEFNPVKTSKMATKRNFFSPLQPRGYSPSLSRRENGSLAWLWNITGIKVSF